MTAGDSDFGANTRLECRGLNRWDSDPSSFLAMTGFPSRRMVWLKDGSSDEMPRLGSQVWHLARPTYGPKPIA